MSAKGIAVFSVIPFAVFYGDLVESESVNCSVRMFWVNDQFLS